VEQPRTVVVVAFEGIQLLDLAGPIEVLDGATQAAEPSGGRGYGVRIATPGGARVRSTSGVEIGADDDLDALPRTLAAEGIAIDTLLVVGGAGTRRAAEDGALLAAVTALADRTRRITSVCTGALVLAAAGLLDGYAATTHWQRCDLLARYPAVEVIPDRIYVRDRNRWTSAGVTAGIDLALALVDDDLGPELAHTVATHLVVFARRPGGQAQFSAQLRAQAATSPAVAGLQRWLPDHLDENLTVAHLAARARMSERHFSRAFHAETGTTPAVHVEELRVEAARRLLETTDLTVAAVARRVGLTHAETLHRAFARRVGTTPARYRQHFARTPAY
jgi:transcriptional regulator GlxA family with amidase domain